MGLTARFLYTTLFLILLLSNKVSANWQGPVEIISGTWGSGDTQFGFESGDTHDLFPAVLDVSIEGNIVITDGINGRFKLYDSKGGLIRNIIPPLENPKDWVIIPVFVDTNIFVPAKKYFFFSLNGTVIAAIDGPGMIDSWKGYDGKLYIEQRAPVRQWLLYSPTGQLIRTSTERPLELGRILETNLGDGRYRYEVQYPERTYSFITPNFLDTVARDAKDYINAIAKVDSGEEYWTYQVDKYSLCGKLIGTLKLPTTRFEPQVVERQKYGIVARRPKVIAEYGQPVIAPNGDVYTWKRTPDKYSILKWTWQDDPNVPAGPDAPTGLTVMPSINGLYLTWTASPQDPGCVTGYEISRATSAGGVYSTIASVEKGVVKYNDTSAAMGTTYYYKIRAKAGSEYSPYTSAVSGKR